MKKSLAPYGIKILPYKVWPGNIINDWFITISYETHRVLINDVTKLHTTQRFVSTEKVEEKITKLLNGEKLAVEIFRDGLNRIWILDGHHTLIAFLELGQIPKGALHRDGSEQLPPAPRFVINP